MEGTEMSSYGKRERLREAFIADDVSESIKLQDENLENMLYRFLGTQLEEGKTD